MEHASLSEVSGKIPGIRGEVTVIHAKELEHYRNYPIKAVAPMMDKDAISGTKQGYRLFTDRYNKSVTERNQWVQDYNQKVEKALLGQPNTEAFRLVERNFAKKHNSLFTRDYNQKVLDENGEKPFPMIKMRRYQPLRDEHERSFELILEGMRRQLKKFREMWKESGKPTTIPKVDINSSNMVWMTHIDGQPMTRKRRQTFLRHKKRMEEAGVLMDKASRGNLRGVHYFISPEILVISDAFDGKTIMAENQLLNSRRIPKCTDNNTLTRAIIKDNVKAVDKPTADITKKSGHPSDDPQSEGTGFLPVSLPAEDFTRAPSGSKEKISGAAAENPEARPPGTNGPLHGTASPKNGIDQAPPGSDRAAGTPKNRDVGQAAGTPKGNLPPENIPKNAGVGQKNVKNTGVPDEKLSRTVQNSQELLHGLEERWPLAYKLGNRNYVDSRPIPPERLVLELDTGTLTKEEFIDVLVQDLFKQFSRLYHHAHPNWFPYHSLWNDKLIEWKHSRFFLHPNGHWLGKKTVYRNYRQLLYCLNNGNHGVVRRVQRGNFTLSPTGMAKYLDPVDNSKGNFMYWYGLVAEKSPGIDGHIKKVREAMERRGHDVARYLKDVERLKNYYLKWVRHQDLGKLHRQISENLCREVARDSAVHIKRFINEKRNYRKRVA